MAKADVDPAELRRFARDLNRFAGELETIMGGLQSRLRDVQRTWRDQEQRKFTDEFEQTMKTLGRFLNAANEHATFLNKKAGYIEDYLQRR